ncbi:hypothetical protein BKA70DRAFT_1093050 [Coprinopsis sp. MPI-PUGE-AT-0042]|nr:hypothetical protein BKA70DRAFT_1093050 [Coprinopsis sp. MPI-PUGE-AT-0042]
MTPTPAFPRARARFDLSPPPSDLLQTPAPRDFAEREDFTTPATRRKSFLLQVVNSNVRPRMKMGTPHPHRFVPATPSIAELTPRAGIQEAVEEMPSSNSSHASTNAAPALRAAFVGLTPRPRAQITARRLSHPLAQGFSANSPQTSDSESATARPGARKPWGTPMINSPYDGANDKASFVSTASSHDLTTHQRVNTSFDPAMGFGAVANVNRFNAGKLNNYLHSLNHKLQEENESLLARLRQMEEERASSSLREEGSPQSNTSRRQSGPHRRISMAGGLDNVLEDNAEAWMEEKADLEDRIEQYLAEKEELEKELEKEKEGRTKDQARFEQRTKETQREALNVLTDIEKDAAAAHQRAQEAEERLAQQSKESEREMEKLKDELDAAYERAGKTERLLENGKDLGGALSEANERIAQIMGDLRNANAQIQGLEDEVAQADHKMHDLEVELKEEKEAALALEQALAAEQEKTQELQQSIDVLEQELVSAKEYTDELEEGVGAQVEALEKELEQAKVTVETLTMAEENSARTIKDLEDGLERQKNLTVQLEEALEEAKNKMSEDDDAISELNSKISSLERERDRWKQLADNPREPSLRLDGGPTEEEMELMERELSVAQKEIARLSTMLAQSPARKAIDKAKEAKIEMLEREKEELLERNKALRMTMNEVQTPGKVVNGSMMSPIHRLVLNNSIRYPKTPGGPLRDMSWLNSTQHDPTMAPLIAEIQRLQHELDEANESIDDKLDKLEDAGLGVVGLTKKLEDARARISQLEDELARNARKEERAVRRLARARCKECNVKLDLHGLTGDESHDFSWTSVSEEDPSPRGRGSELKAQLHAANASLENLRQEMEELQADNKRLGGQVRNAKAEVKKVAEGRGSSDNMQMELERAKETIATLEDALATERSKLRSLTVEQQIVEREKKHCLQDLERTELDMENIREQLQKLKRQNDDLEKELRQNSTAEQKARLLESKVSANMETISQLRQERSLLSSDHKDLQRRYSELSETVSRLKEEHAAHSTSHDQHRHKLDLQVLEIEELKQALDDRSSQLHRAERELEKERQASDKPDMSKTIATLEADLRRVRRDAEAFGRDLKTLRAEKDKLEAKLKDELTKGERAKKQSNTQVKLLNEQVETQKRKLAKALEEFESHVCGSDENQVSTLQIQHHKECKGLLVQIKYLKAKFLRESSFREDLSYQKNYLLVLLSKFEKSEKTIFASIARIGFPVAPAKNRRTRKLKSLAMMIMFLNRVKKGCSVWKEHTATKAAVTAALDDVRKRRALTAS